MEKKLIYQSKIFSATTMLSLSISLEFPFQASITDISRDEKTEYALAEWAHACAYNALAGRMIDEVNALPTWK